MFSVNAKGLINFGCLDSCFAKTKNKNEIKSEIHIYLFQTMKFFICKIVLQYRPMLLFLSCWTIVTLILFPSLHRILRILKKTPYSIKICIYHEGLILMFNRCLLTVLCLFVIINNFPEPLMSYKCQNKCSLLLQNVTKYLA